VNEKLGANYKTKAIQNFSKKREQILKSLFSNSRTSALWATYHYLVSLVKDYIRAGRMHEFEMHLSTSSRVLPYFTSDGRG